MASHRLLDEDVPGVENTLKLVRDCGLRTSDRVIGRALRGRGLQLFRLLLKYLQLGRRQRHLVRMEGGNGGGLLPKHCQVG